MVFCQPNLCFYDDLFIVMFDYFGVGTQEQTKKVLKHLERIIVKKAVLLSKISEARKIPKSVCLCMRGGGEALRWG